MRTTFPVNLSLLWWRVITAFLAPSRCCGRWGCCCAGRAGRDRRYRHHSFGVGGAVVGDMAGCPGGDAAGPPAHEPPDTSPGLCRGGASGAVEH